jgi:hypothetical protein
MALCCGLTGPVAAQEVPAEPLPSYRVEILVFEMTAGARRPEDPGRPPLPPEPEPGLLESLTGDIELAGPAPEAAEEAVEAGPEGMELGPEEAPETFFFEPVEPQDLGTMAAVLRRRSGFRVLAHEAWRQPGFPRNASKSVDLETVGRVRERIEYEAALEEGIRPPKPAVAAGTTANTTAGEEMAEPESLVATATLWRGRYLHLDIDTALSRGEFVMRLYESRRMRSGELHYFDSPDLGAIAVIVPDEGETAEGEDESEATAGCLA